MAHSYKNIVITPNIGANTDPFVQFSGGNTTVNTDVTLRVYPDSNGTLSFEGSAGQLFSITNDLTGSIFSVNDVSGIPLIEVNVASQQITFGEFYGNVGIGKAASTSSTYKLDVNGTINASNILINGNAITGSLTSLTPANNYSNTLYTSALSFANGAANSANAYSITVGAASNTRANTVGTAGNNYTITIVTGVNSNAVNNSVGANTWANTLSTIDRAIANAAANSANAYTVTVGAASNNYANTIGTNTALAYTWTNTHTYQSTVSFSSNVFVRNTANVVWITNAASTTSNVTLRTYADSNGTLSFEGSAGQLFSITNDLTGSIFSVNDVSGIPLFEVNVSSQQITLGEFYGNVGIGKTSSTSSIYKLDVNGTINASNVLINGNTITGSVTSLTPANNYANTVGAASNTWANGVGTAGNNYTVTIITGVNSNAVNNAVGANGWANTLSTSDRAIANAAANSANAYTVTVGAASNTWANGLSTSDRAISNGAANSANAYAVTIGTAGNNYAIQIGAASNTWANSLNAKVFVSDTGPTGNTNGTLWWNSELGRLLVYYSDGDSSQWVEANPVITGSVNDAANSSNSYAVTVGAASNNYAIQVGAASNTWANTKLSNTSGVWTAGNLNVTGYANASSFVYDSKGDVRDIPLNTQSVIYALTINDTGKVISTTGNVFVPNTVFSSGQTVSVYNNSAASITITQNSSVTMYLGGSATTGNRTLAQRGLASILCVAANTFVISGVGLT